MDLPGELATEDMVPPPYPSIGCLGTSKHPIPGMTLREALQGHISALDPRNPDAMTTASAHPDTILDVETGEERPCTPWPPSLLAGLPLCATFHLHSPFP